MRENVEVECKGRIYSFIMVPIRGHSYVNLYGRDITERNRAMERLQKAYDQLKEAQSQLVQAEKMQVVGTLASGVAHEVKNPLATIQQGLDYLKENNRAKDKNTSSILEYMEEAVKKALPGLNCGLCGSPTCDTFANDVAAGHASKQDCVFLSDERMRHLRETFKDKPRQSGD